MTDAKEYAKALFSLTEEYGTTEKTLSDLNDLCGAWRENPTYVKLLDTPSVATAEKLPLLQASMAGMDSSLCDLFCILCEKRATYLYREIAKAYCREYDNARGILRAQVVTAVPLTEAQSSALAAKLSRVTGKRTVLANTVDPSVLGGVILRYADTQLDGSVRARLEKIRTSLKNAIL